MRPADPVDRTGAASVDRPEAAPVDRTEAAPVAAVAAVFVVTGAIAAGLQVVWQRVVSMNMGVDVAGTTTVVAAFLAGLGLGGLLGGRLADRLGGRRSLFAFAATNVVVAVLAWVSVEVLYTGLTEPGLAAVFVALLVPTTLQGMSLPLVARAVAGGRADPAPLVSRLYGVNTLGAAVGAVVTGWVLVGSYGFVSSARIIAVAGVVAAAVVLALGLRSSTAPARAVPAAPDLPVDDLPAAPVGRVGTWYALAAASGAVALGFEQVFFRLVDAAVRSNSYSFSLVLAIYLGLWGTGMALGAPLARRTVHHRQWFLALQAGAGLVAACGVIVLIRVLPAGGTSSALGRWFASDGFVSGFERERLGDAIRFALGIPALVMGLPVLLMGASYPMLQSGVRAAGGVVGRRTGGLVASNVAGNVIGTLLVGFVLLDRLGTAGTMRVLVCVTLVAAVALVRERRTAMIGVAALVVAVVALPDNRTLWAVLVGSEPGTASETVVAEDRACASVLEPVGDADQLVINGAPQNGHPFDDFHVMIGLLPALVHDDPADTLAIGYGIGSTTYGLLAEPSTGSATTVELCGGNYELADGLRAAGVDDFERLADDPRSTLVVGDGRRRLVTDDRAYDVVVVDTLRPTSANSGSHFSQEFFELIGDHLAPGGIVVSWVPSGRVVNSAGAALPHAQVVSSPVLGDSSFVVAGPSPIRIDVAALVERYDDLPAGLFEPEQRRRLRSALTSLSVDCVTDGSPLTGVPSDEINRDLRPRDEYPVNNLALPVRDARSNC